MQVLICGYGKMGQEIEKTLVSRKHHVLARVDPHHKDADSKTMREDQLAAADMVIEFTRAEAVQGHLNAYLAHSTPAVIGTTGWNPDQYEDVLHQNTVPILFGTNFSIGAHMLRFLTAALATMLNQAPEYDIMLHEMHHKMKKDSPSGTALTLADSIIQSMERKTRIVSSTVQEPIKDDELHVLGIRGGTIPGTHQITADSNADSIEIIHRARSRAGFSLGAVRAAEWLLTQPPGTYDVASYMKEILGRQQPC